MIREYDKKIIPEDGAEFYGFGFGDDSEKIVEVVFNSSMVGYQEILSDPSYTGQASVMYSRSWQRACDRCSDAQRNSK